MYFCHAASCSCVTLGSVVSTGSMSVQQEALSSEEEVFPVIIFSVHSKHCESLPLPQSVHMYQS